MERLKEQFKLLKFTTYKHCGPYGTDITICDVPSYPHSTRYRVKGVNTSKVPTAIQCPGCNYVLDQKKLGEHICRPSPRQYKKQCQGVVPCSKCPPVCYVTQRALDLHNYLHKASFLLYCWMCRVAHEDNQCPNLFNCQDCKAFVLNDAQALKWHHSRVMTASGTFTLSSNLTSVLNIIFPLELLDLMLSYAVDSDIQIAEVFLDAKKEKEQCKVSFCSEKTWCKWCNVVHPKSSCPKVLTRCLECKTVFPTDDTISDAWHNEYCVKIAECEKCDRKDTRWNLRSRKHNDTCPKTLILCVQCLKLFERATMYSHLSNDCPETDVKPQCKCQAFLASVKRKDLQKEHDCFDVLLEELRRVKRQEYRNPFPLYGFAK